MEMTCFAADQQRIRRMFWTLRALFKSRVSK